MTNKFKLTDREIEVLQHLCEGMLCKESAHVLGLSHRTVEIHRRTAFGKLGAKNQVHAAVLFDREQRCAGCV